MRCLDTLRQLQTIRLERIAQDETEDKRVEGDCDEERSSEEVYGPGITKETKSEAT